MIKCFLTLFSLLPEAPVVLKILKFFRRLRPLAPSQGLCPWTPMGAVPPDPCHSLLASAARRLTALPIFVILKLGCTNT